MPASNILALGTICLLAGSHSNGLIFIGQIKKTSKIGK